MIGAAIKPNRVWYIPVEQKEIRCFNCNQKFFDGEVKSIEIKCPRCKQMTRIGTLP